jgi:hypothetical protein
MAPRDDGGGWDEYRRLILAALERLEAAIKELDAKMDLAHTDITMLKVKASLWGAGAGAIASALISALVSRLLK